MSQQSSLLHQILRTLSSMVRTQQMQRPDDYWRNVSGAQPGSYSVQSNIQSAITSALGPLYGGLLNRYVLGSEFNRTGNFSSSLGGMLLPQGGGTYSGAFSNMLQDAARTATYYARQNEIQKLRGQFYNSYFSMLYPSDTATQRQQRIASAQRNPVQAAPLLQIFADPSQVSRSVEGIQVAQAGVLQWSNRRNPLDTAAISRANEMSSVVSLVAQQAQRKAVFGKGESYGGFTGGAVAQLAGMLANASDTLGTASGQELTTALQKFKTKVRDTTKALQPLRDILGQDVKAMVNVVQGFTGQNISQLSTGTIQNVATRVADIQRYAPGVSLGQMTDMGEAMRQMLYNNGIRGYAALGAGVLGADVAGALVPGNTAYGMTAKEFQADTLNSYAGAQGSRGVDYISMAYSLWKQNNNKGTLQQFKDRLSEAQANGQDALSAARDLAGVKSNGQLIKGLQYSDYRQAQMSGTFATTGVQQQWRQQRDIKALQLMQTGQWSRADIDKAMREFSNPQVMAEISRTGNVDGVKGLSAMSRNILNYAVSTDTKFLAGARRVSQIQQQEQYGRTMATIREAFKDIDDTGGSGWNNFFGRFIQNNWGDQSGVYKLFAQQIYGQSDMTKVQGINDKLQGTLGKAGMQQALRYGFLGAGRSDKEFRKHLRALSTGDKESQEYKKSEQYVLSALAIGQDKKLKDMAASKQGQGAYGDFVTDLQKADKLSDPVSRQNAIINARHSYRNRLNAMVRSKALNQSADEEFTADVRASMQTLLQAQAQGTDVDQNYFKKNKGKFKGIDSFSEYKRLRSKLGGSDTNSDTMGRLNSVLQQIANFLKQIVNEKGKK